MKDAMKGPGDMRPVDGARLVLGGLALFRPGWLLGVIGSDDGRWPRRVTRILGARYVVQSGLSVTLGTPWTSDVDGAIDLVHAASTVGFAALFPRHRRVAIVSCALALGFAVADLREGPMTEHLRPRLSASPHHGAPALPPVRLGRSI